MRPLEVERSSGLGIQADLLPQSSEARVRPHPGKFWIQDNDGETPIVLRKHFFQIFECVFFVAKAGVDLGQTRVWDGPRWISALQALLEETKSLITLSCSHIGAGRPAEYASWRRRRSPSVSILDRGQRLGGSPLQIESASQKAE